MSILNYFKDINLSIDQEKTLVMLEEFFNSQKQVFLLKGYAGTGKTTILKGLSTYLDSQKKEFELMAPTGRAAKILRDKTNHGRTIHSCIYNLENIESINHESEEHADHSFHYLFPIKKNVTDEKIIIVDEASMISSKESSQELFSFGTNVLLDDLLTYTFGSNPKNKIIFVGDPAQLPPVGDNQSCALDKTFFEKHCISYDETEMHIVLRQEKNLILSNSELIRNLLEQTKPSILNLNFDNNSFINLKPIELINKYTELFSVPEIEKSVIISYSNSQCYQYNMAIRESIFPGKKEITAGDLIIICNNNYHTYGTELFNGDIAKVINVSKEIICQTTPLFVEENGNKIKKIISLNFRAITIRIPTYNNDIECFIIDSLLHNINRDLSVEEMKALYVNFVIRFNESQAQRKKDGVYVSKIGSIEFKDSLKQDPFFNALRVKFGYAITCHKAQGGEWDNVFVNFYGRISLKKEPLRWCYTAITRGRNVVYAVNSPHFGKLDKFKFSAIGQIGAFPIDSLQLDHIATSPFHNNTQHKCKSLKYWEIFDKTENSNYSIKKVESFDYLERYTLLKDNIEITIQAYHKSSGHFSENFKVISNTEDSIKAEIENLLSSEYCHNYNLSYSPNEELLSELYSIMQENCNNLDIIITNIVEKKEKYFVIYYLKTNSICSYIQFYFNDKGQLTSAIPKTYNCENDIKLQLLIKMLTDYAN